MAHKKAASVLPEPVGARMRVLSPAAIEGQPRSWAGVRPAKDLSNQAWVAGENPGRATLGSYRLAPPVGPAPGSVRRGRLVDCLDGDRAVGGPPAPASTDPGGRLRRLDPPRPCRLPRLVPPGRRLVRPALRLDRPRGVLRLHRHPAP